jgi:hypothetical protein
VIASPLHVSRRAAAGPFLQRQWLLVSLLVASLAHARFLVRAFTQPGRPYVNPDAVIYQHAGWLMTQGAKPYLNIWEIKPPLFFETTTLMALASGGDMLRMLLLGVAFNLVCSIGSMVLVGLITYRLTGSGLAGLAAGLVLLAMPAYAWLPAFGIREKYALMFFGILAIYLQMTGRPLLAGVSAAAATNFHQLGLIFAVIVLGLAIQNRSTRQALLGLGGMAILTIVSVLPMLLMGLFEPMIVEVVFASILVGEKRTLLGRLYIGVTLLTFAAPLVPAGIAGVVLGFWRDARRTWWVLLGGAWFGFNVFFTDLDGYGDLFAGMLFVALRFGWLVARVPRTFTNALTAVAAAIVVMVVLVRPLAQPQDKELASDPHREGLPSLSYMYWNKFIPQTCHYRLGESERSWIRLTQGDYSEKECGRWEEVRRLLDRPAPGAAG